MSQNGGQTVPRITRAEHIGPNDTGDNIEAKRVAPYYWDGSGWQRQPLSNGGQAGLVTSPYDYIAATYPDSVTEVYTFKSGGSDGTTVAVITIVYTTADKDILSTVTKT